ncbi:MAG: polysaccharide deacetylase family protein [Oscillospiraceae bacterium]|nr:polysaccharide deacetylase family protein [Oscillospiraceae bacterium]
MGTETDRYEDIYKEYPELRDLRPRRPGERSSGGGKRRMKNSAKLFLLIVVIAAISVILVAAVQVFGSETVALYNRDGSVVMVDESEAEKYISEGWYSDAADIVPVTLYAEDGSSIRAVAGDAPALIGQGYSTSKASAFTTLYKESGETLYVPNTVKSTYTAKGWTDKLSDITKTLYKSNGSKITVINSEVDKHLAEGWTDKLLMVAKKMVKDGEEKTVFNDDIDKYLADGWAVKKRQIDPDQPMVALTFDDGPGKYTSRLLDCLEKYNSAATFYTLGYLDEAYPDIVKREAELGCEVSNHTWDHTNLTTVNADTAASVIKQTSDKVKELTGKSTPTYRPCYGAYNANVLSAIDLPAIMWSIDTLDWKTKNADSTYNKVISDVYDGAIILMHDIHEPTIDAAVRIIPALVEQGYQLVTVSELLEYKQGGMENGKVYFDAFEIK